MNKLIKSHLPYINLAKPKITKNPSLYYIFFFFKFEFVFRNDDLKDYNKIQNELMDEIPYEDKLKFTQKIKYVNQDQLGQIVQTIQLESSEAFKDVIEIKKCSYENELILIRQKKRSVK